MTKSRTKPKPKAKPTRSTRGGWKGRVDPSDFNGDLTPSTRGKKPYTKERVAGLKPAWESGQSGNPTGRPLGARSRFTEAFFEEVLASWQTYGRAAIEWVATNDRPLFVQVCAALVPRNVKAELETVQKPIYVMSGQPISPEEWAAKYCDPEIDGKAN